MILYASNSARQELSDKWSRITHVKYRFMILYAIGKNFDDRRESRVFCVVGKSGHRCQLLALGAPKQLGASRLRPGDDRRWVFAIIRGPCGRAAKSLARRCRAEPRTSTLSEGVLRLQATRRTATAPRSLPSHYFVCSLFSLCRRMYSVCDGAVLS